MEDYDLELPQSLPVEPLSESYSIEDLRDILDDDVMGAATSLWDRNDFLLWPQSEALEEEFLLSGDERENAGCLAKLSRKPSKNEEETESQHSDITCSSGEDRAASRVSRCLVDQTPTRSVTEKKDTISSHKPNCSDRRTPEKLDIPLELLGDLAGTTSEKVRHMTAEERKLVYLRRKLRNRESARRSRERKKNLLKGAVCAKAKTSATPAKSRTA